MLAEAKINFDVFARSIKYTENKDYVKDLKIKLKPSREKPGGLINVEGTLIKQLDGFFFDICLSYQYGTIFRTYLIDYKGVEVCELLKKERNFKYSNPLTDIFVMVIKNCCPVVYHECPFKPFHFDRKNIDVNETVAPRLPPVVPAGETF